MRSSPTGGSRKAMPPPRAAARPDSSSSGVPDPRHRGRPVDRLPPAAALMSSLSGGCRGAAPRLACSGRRRSASERGAKIIAGAAQAPGEVSVEAGVRKPCIARGRTKGQRARTPRHATPHPPLPPPPAPRPTQTCTRRAGGRLTAASTSCWAWTRVKTRGGASTTTSTSTPWWAGPRPPPVPPPRQSPGQGGADWGSGSHTRLHPPACTATPAPACPRSGASSRASARAAPAFASPWSRRCPRWLATCVPSPSGSPQVCSGARPRRAHETSSWRAASRAPPRTPRDAPPPPRPTPPRPGGRWISVTVGPVLVRSADDVVEVYARMRADARLRYFL